jgi:selenocysteine lyase/cysteine desulfurase
LLKRGDTVMHGNLDYDAIIYAMDDLAARHGARSVTVQLGDRDYAASDIRSRVHAGTFNSAAAMTIPAALAISSAHRDSE